MTYLTWFAFVVACFSSLPRQAVGAEDNLALHFTSSYGVEVKLPYFEDFHEMESDVREIVNLHISDIVIYLNTTLGDMLVGKNAGKMSRIQSFRVTGTLAKKGWNYIGVRKRLGKPSGTSPEFNNVMKPMFQRLLEGCTKIEKELKKRKATINSVWLERRKTRLFGTLNETLNHPDNQVSIYFDWLGATLTDPEVSPNPQPLERELTDVLGHLRYQGFGNVMDGIETLVNLIFWWSGKGWK